MVVSSARLTRMQAVVEQTMTDECLIERYTEVSDGQGGTTQDWTVVGVVDCRVAPAGTSAVEREVAAQLQASSAYTITMPAGTIILSPDRIEVDGETYEVVKPLTRTLEIETRVVTEKVS